MGKPDYHSAEDVEAAITEPLERKLVGLDTVREMTSTSNRGFASISLEYEEGSDMDIALDRHDDGQRTILPVSLPRQNIQDVS